MSDEKLIAEGFRRHHASGYCPCGRHLDIDIVLTFADGELQATYSNVKAGPPPPPHPPLRDAPVAVDPVPEGGFDWSDG